MVICLCPIQCLENVFILLGPFSILLCNKNDALLLNIFTVKHYSCNFRGTGF